ncbi:MAG: GtrA family protein [bacterium]|nr:GtrA family protein [bacterium]
MIKRIWKWGVNKFWNRKFITFCIIGVLNTLIHLATLYLMYRLFELINVLQTENLVTVKVLIGNAIAFIVASTFSYFANNYVTFKNKTSSKKTFMESMVIFLARFGLTELLTFIIVSIFKACKLSDIWIKYVGPFSASIIMIPIAYIFLAKVLDHSSKDKKEDNNDEIIDENSENV